MTASLPLRRCALALLALAGSPAIASAQEQEPRVRLFHSDSIDVSSPTLSPDSRWLVFSRTDAPNQASLWIQPAAGGEARRLTSSGHYDDIVRWMPDGEAVVFRSTRPARGGDTSPYVMLLPINPATGEATGAARQVSADPVGYALRPSPDGAWIAYQYGLDQTQVRVVPRSGGTAHIAMTLPGVAASLGWTANGQAVLANVRTRDGQFAIYRAPATGGEPQHIATHRRRDLLFSPDGMHTVSFVEGPGPRDRTIVVVEIPGAVVQRIATNTSTRAAAFTSDGRGLLLVENNVIAPTRLMSITGTQSRDLTAGNTYDWVMGFSADGSAVLTWTQNETSALLTRVSLDGGRRQDYPETRARGWGAATYDHLLRVLRPENAARHTLEAVSVRDGSTHRVTDALHAVNPFVPGPGGAFALGEEIYFDVRDGGGRAVHAWKAPGQSRIVRDFSRGPEPLALAAHGNLIAWEQARGDSLDVMLADGSSAAPRRLYTHLNAVPAGNELAFSHDGRRLVLHTAGADRRQDLMLILAVAGKAQPRIIDPGLVYWYWPRWLPDNTGIAVIGGGVGSESNVVVVPLTNGSKPINITRDDPSPKWGFELSPDGQWIAYPGEVWKGSTIWKMDLKVR